MFAYSCADYSYGYTQLWTNSVYCEKTFSYQWLVYFLYSMLWYLINIFYSNIYSLYSIFRHIAIICKYVHCKQFLFKGLTAKITYTVVKGHCTRINLNPWHPKNHLRIKYSKSISYEWSRIVYYDFWTTELILIWLKYWYFTEWLFIKITWIIFGVCFMKVHFLSVIDFIIAFMLVE